MTNEERIDWLCRLRTDIDNGIIYTPWKDEFIEALNGVVEALGEYEDRLVASFVMMNKYQNILDCMQKEIDKYKESEKNG